MKKILSWIWIPIAALTVFFIGFFVRQPKINKLKSQVISLQKQLGNLQNKMIGYQDSFDNLYIQYKGLKVLELKKKAEYEGKLKDNLILQYGIKAYLEMLLDTVKKSRKLTSEEFAFYRAFDDVIEGKQVGTNAFLKIKEYVLSKYKREVNALTPCDCSIEFQKLQEYRSA